KVADEIIVLDSYSTDQTIEIARHHGATIFQEKFRGYIGQKNFAMQLASNNYILSLDADEALNDKLVASILEAKKSFVSRAYSMNSIASLSLYSSGCRSSWFKILVHPAWAFINGYFFRLGFLDGFDGFTIAINTSHQVFLKYNKLYRLQRAKPKPATAPIARP